MHFLILITGLIFLFPMFVLIRIYFYVKSTSYLFFASMFFAASVDQFLVGLDLEGFTAEALITLSFVWINIILYAITAETCNYRIPVKPKVYLSYAIFVIISTIILKLLTFGDKTADLRLIWTLNGEIFRTVTGILIIIGIRRTLLLVNIKRVQFIKVLWLFVGYAFLTLGGLRIVVNSVLITDAFITNIITDRMLVFLSSLSESTGVILIFTIGIFSLILTFVYPEAMLISEVQIRKATGLYDLLDGDQTEQASSSKYGIIESIDIIKEYLQQIPDQYFRNPDGERKENSDD